MGGGDRLFQANPSKFGPQPPAILYATQPTKDTVDGTEASVEMQSSLNGAKSDVLMNTAVVVVEKSALTQDVVRMIKATLQVYGVSVVASREVTGRTVRARSLVDLHFADVAEHALLTQPQDLKVTEDIQQEFARAFGEEWLSACHAGRVYNAKSALTALAMTPAELAGACRHATDMGRSLVVAGPAELPTVCCKLVRAEVELYVINGGYPETRESFQSDDGAAAYVLEVAFEASQLPFRQFRRKVVGIWPDPVPGSMCATIRRDWRELGLRSPPGVGIERGVYSSESVLVGLKDSLAWGLLNVDGIDERGRDPAPAQHHDGAQGRLVRLLFARGIGRATLRALLQDPLVPDSGQERGGGPEGRGGDGGGSKVRLSTLVRETDVQECVALASKAAAALEPATGGDLKGRSQGTLGADWAGRRPHLSSVEGGGWAGGSGGELESKLEWYKEQRGAMLKEYAALEEQVDSLIDAVAQKDGCIRQLEAETEHARREKEPLVQELVHALEGYNTLSAAIHDSGLQLDVKESGVGVAAAGEILPERTRESVKVVEAVYAELARERAMVAGLQEKVTELVAARHAQEMVLETLTRNAEASEIARAQADAAYECQLGRARALEAELRLVSEAKRSLDHEMQLLQMQHARNASAAPGRSVEARGGVALLDAADAGSDGDGAHALHALAVAHEDARRTRAQLDEVEQRVLPQTQAALSALTHQVADAATVYARMRCVVEGMALRIWPDGLRQSEDARGETLRPGEWSATAGVPEGAEHAAGLCEAMRQTLDTLEQLDTHDAVQQERGVALAADFARATEVAEECRLEISELAARTAQLEREREPLAQELVDAIQALTLLHHAVRGAVVPAVGVGMVVRVLRGRGPNGEVLPEADGFKCYVKSVDGGGAASRSGLAEGDELLSVNGRPCAQLSSEELQGLFRGPQGSQVLLTGKSCRSAPTGRPRAARERTEFFSVRLTRQAEGAGAEGGGWDAIKGAAGDTVGLAEDLHAETERLYRALESEKHRVMRLSAMVSGKSGGSERPPSTTATHPGAGASNSRAARGGLGSGSAGQRERVLIGGVQVELDHHHHQGAGTIRPGLESGVALSGSEVRVQDDAGAPQGGRRDVDAAVLSGDEVGVGMRITETSPFRVVSLVTGGSAMASGMIREGDVLLAVDGVKVKHMSFGSLRARLLGKPRTKVTLSLSRQPLGHSGVGGGRPAVSPRTLGLGERMFGSVTPPSVEKAVSVTVMLERGFPFSGDLVLAPPCQRQSGGVDAGQEAQGQSCPGPQLTHASAEAGTVHVAGITGVASPGNRSSCGSDATSTWEASATASDLPVTEFSQRSPTKQAPSLRRRLGVEEERVAAGSGEGHLILAPSGQGQGQVSVRGGSITGGVRGGGSHHGKKGSDVGAGLESESEYEDV